MSLHYTDDALIQIGTTIFHTLETRKDIADLLAEYGYDEAKISEGKTLYHQATASQESNRKETNEEIEAHQVFDNLFKALVETYKAHRKRAKVVFKDQPATLKILALTGTMPLRILSVLQEIEILYTELDKDESLKNALKIMKITPEDITAQLSKLAEVRTAYAKYTAEKGESQQATKDKNQAFGAFEKWVRNFHNLAKIALEDQPQLLESLGKFIRS